MSEVRPESAEAFAAELLARREAGNTIELGGHFSKRALGGPAMEADVRLSTGSLDRVLEYEPADLTVSVQAGMPWKTFEETLAANNQFVPIDPAFNEQATVGGVVASNSSGPRRRQYGTARDLVIGMEMATLEGKLVESGGMVVKNVTGLDMAKLMIGSMGTLAAITRVNFKVYPQPEAAATFLFSSAKAETLLGLRDKMLRGQAQPAALDLLNGAALAALDLSGESAFVLAAEALGSPAVVARYQREFEALAGEGVDLMMLEGDRGAAFWGAVRELPAVETSGGRCWLRVSATGTRLREAVRLASTDAVLLVRAANGVIYLSVEAEAVAEQMKTLREAGFVTLLEMGPDAAKRQVEAWAAPGTDFEVMRRLKETFDPRGLLNTGRLFGRI